MSQGEITQIRVGNSPVGMIGIKVVMEEMVAEGFGARLDQEVREELLKSFGKKELHPTEGARGLWKGLSEGI